MRKLDVQGDPIVVVENDTHVLCVRSFPSDRVQPEYVVWRKDLDGNVSAGSYFPTFGSQVEAFAEALACFDARSKANLRLGAELQRAEEDLARVKSELEELRYDLRLMRNVHEEERAKVKETLTATLEEQTQTYDSLMSKLRR